MRQRAGRTISRLLDANLNRSREGFRVIEDTARFVLNDGKLYLKLRALRHRVSKAAGAAYPGLLASRDVARDRGRGIPEGARSGLKGLVTANFRRVEESLRVLEEYGKLISADAGREFKGIRYRAYGIEKEMMSFFDKQPHGY